MLEVSAAIEQRLCRIVQPTVKALRIFLYYTALCNINH